MTAETAGYSKRPLLEKLGINEETRGVILGAPPGYRQTLGGLPSGVVMGEPMRPPLDFVQVFVKSRKQLERELPNLKEVLAPAGMLWISWPKRGSGVESDVDEGTVRDMGLGAGLVDVKVAAIDEIWSGLKFVRRLKDRA